MSWLGTSNTLTSDGTYSYSYDPSGGVTAVQASGGSPFTAMSDQHGDLTATFSPTPTAAGLAGSASYTPYGMATSSGYPPSLGYQGDYTDPATGQVDMNARSYSPATGAFTSNDTIAGSPLSSTIDGNPYAYANGNPVTYTDPTGHLCGVFAFVCDPAVNVGRWAGEDGGSLVDYAAPVIEGVGARGPVDRAHRDRLDPLAHPDRQRLWRGRYLHRSRTRDIDLLLLLRPVRLARLRRRRRPGHRKLARRRPRTSLCAIYTCAPPPPPQDCYAGADATCRAPTASHALRYSPWITSLVRDITSASSLLRNGRGIHEQVPISTAQPSGTKSSPTTNGNPLASPGDGLDQLLKDIHDLRPRPPQASHPRHRQRRHRRGRGWRRSSCRFWRRGGTRRTAAPPKTSPQAAAAATSPTSGGNHRVGGGRKRRPQAAAPGRAAASPAVVPQPAPEESGGGQRALKSMADRTKHHNKKKTWSARQQDTLQPSTSE